MIKITVKPAVEEALSAAFPAPKNTASRALTKYVNKLEQLLHEALVRGQTPAQKKLGAYSISLQRLANEGGQIGSRKTRVHAWLRDNKYALVTTVTQGSNLTEKVSEVRFTDLVEFEEFEADSDGDLDALANHVGEFSGEQPQTGDWDPAQYDVLEVDQRSLRGYIQWLQAKATLMSESERLTALTQAQTILAVSLKNGGRYFQRKKYSQFGRTYYEGLSIQNVNKELRRAILGHCWEYDIRSSVISWKMGFAQPYVDKIGSGQSVRDVFSTTIGYLEDRADFMRTIRHFVFLDGSNVPKELQTKLLKQAVTAISFGARATTTGWYDMAGQWTNPALVEIIRNPEERARFLGDTTIRQFIQEQNTLDAIIFDHFKTQASDLLTEPNLLTLGGHVSKSRVLAYFYQHVETGVMDLVREIAEEYGHKPIANIHDAVFFRRRLGTELKSEIELTVQEQWSNSYWKFAATELQPYMHVDKETLDFEAEHRARIAEEERMAVGFSHTMQNMFDCVDI